AGYTAARSGERVDEYIDDDYFDPGEDYPDDDVVDDYVADYEDDYYDEYHDIDEDEYDDDVRIQGGAQRAHEDYADEDAAVTEADLEEPADARSPGRQWLMLAGQLALGVVSGAGVWLGFSWLWNKFPSAALIAALIATVGLVWIVRKVRRADDTQTTVLAVLVGLIVTVSPAALMRDERYRVVARDVPLSAAHRCVGGARDVPIGLSTASVWPLGATAAFEIAAELGYDGVEVMVWADPASQDVAALRRV